MAQVCSLELSGERLVQQRLFQIVQRGEFAFVDGGEALGFFAQFGKPIGDCLLLIGCGD